VNPLGKKEQLKREFRKKRMKEGWTQPKTAKEMGIVSEKEPECRYCGNIEFMDGLCEVCYYKFREF
jgi:recombinational DNA repair protein RecR